MAGTVYTPIWEANGVKRSFLVGTANITLGDVVALDTGNANTVVTGTEALANVAIGVATECRRTNLSIANSSAQVAAVNEYVTVTMSGVMNVTANGSITTGNLISAANDGEVLAQTIGAGNYASV